MIDVRHISRSLQRRVRERAKECCEYCKSRSAFSTAPFVMEHITPRAKGGHTTFDNLAYACGGCNGHKAAKINASDPHNNEVTSLYHPRQQNWHDHFRWSDDLSRIEALTNIGRATIEALHMNRPELIRLRRVLAAVGEHPTQM